MTILRATNPNDGVVYKIDSRDIDIEFNLTDEYASDLQEVANILACNVEHPRQFKNNGCLIITKVNFNDCFEDMRAVLEGTDEEDEDEDDDD